ncbi:MAG TPA: hypothetical protein PLV45_08595 [bacterium]|nr:hypothetical protein [bacterium]
MSRQEPSIDTAIDTIVRWFKTTYAGPDGFPVYDVDGTTGRPVTGRNLLCEFDDYVPFFWMLGETDFVMKQFTLLESRITAGRILFNRPQIRERKGLGLPGIFRRLCYADSQDYVEIMYGLLELYDLSGNPRFLESAQKLMDIIIRCFYRHGMLRSFRLIPAGPTLSVSDAMSGMLIEIMADLSARSRDSAGTSKWFDYAAECLANWIYSDMFVRYGVFPSVVFEWPWTWFPEIRRRMRSAELAKANTSMAYGLFSMALPPHEHPPAREALDRWVDGLYQYFSTPKCVLMHHPRFNPGDPEGPILSTNFAALDLLCDIYHCFQWEKCRDLAVNITDFFLEYQSPVTGLIPDEPGTSRSYLDANSDFAVSLVKMTEITGSDHYRRAGRKILDGVLTHHRGPFGYFRDVDVNNGEPLNTLVETRFCSLLLKPLLLYRDRMTIYGEDGRWSLFRDR